MLRRLALAIFISIPCPLLFGLSVTTPRNQHVISCNESSPSRLFPSVVCGQFQYVAIGSYFAKGTPKDQKDYSLIHELKPYLGLHFGKLVSIHASQGYSNIDDSKKWKKKEETAYVQIGHVLESKWNLSLGKLKLPFGLDLQASPPYLGEDRLEQVPASLWGAIARHAFSNEFRLEYGQFYTRSFSESFTDLNVIEYRSLRLSYEMSALEGTKLIASASQELASQDVKLGLAILNYSEGRSSSLEWVRTIYKDSQDQVYIQLFRFNYFSEIKDAHRWYLEYENVRKDYWLLAYGNEILAFNDRLGWGLGAEYRKEPTRDKEDLWALRLTLKIYW